MKWSTEGNSNLKSLSKFGPNSRSYSWRLTISIADRMWLYPASLMGIRSGIDIPFALFTSRYPRRTSSSLLATKLIHSLRPLPFSLKRAGKPSIKKFPSTTFTCLRELWQGCVWHNWNVFVYIKGYCIHMYVTVVLMEIWCVLKRKLG